MSEGLSPSLFSVLSNPKIEYNKKLSEIQENPLRSYKTLRRPLQGFNRVHIDGHFVLIFQVRHDIRAVEVWYYGHHDEVYKGKFTLQE